MKKYYFLLLSFACITFLMCACDNEPNNPNNPNNSYSVFQKEYRTHGTESMDEYWGHITSYGIIQFDNPKNGSYSSFWQTYDDKGNAVGGIENVNYTPPTYRQKGQLVIVDYGKQYFDTLISYGDSVVGKWDTYYYYGSSIPKTENLILSNDSIIMYVGDVSYIDVIENKQNKEHISSSCSWLSSDTTIATVNSGNVYGKKEGCVTITAYYNGDSAKCSLTVLRDSMILPENVYMTEGVSHQLQCTFTSQKYRYIVWHSSDEETVSVSSDGLLYAKKLGSVTITVTAGEYVRTCKVFVNPTTGEINGHEWVDLGLSVLWASMNVGAETPSGRGISCCWANPYSGGGYNSDYWCSQAFYIDSNNKPHLAQYSKYQVDDGDLAEPYYSVDTIKTMDDDGYEHVEYEYTFTGDGKTNVERDDDAVFRAWGNGWRLPSKEEYQELIDNCEFEYVNLDGIPGYKVKSNINNQNIFFPNVQFVNEYGNHTGYVCNYWTSNLTTSSRYAHMMDFQYHTGYGNLQEVRATSRSYGLGVRGVINRQ